MDSKEAAGVSVLVIRGGRETGYCEAGLADREAGRKMSRDAIFRMYSMTKPIIGFLFMRLWEEGRIDPLAPVSGYLPEYASLTAGENREPLQRSLSVHHLLSMTSGLTYGGTGNETERLTQELLNGIEKTAGEENAPDTRKVAYMLSKIPLAFQPGTHWQYGMSADVLGAVAEQASGTSLRELLKEEVLDPLGMQDTDFYVPAEKQGRLAAVYMQKGKDLALYSENHLGIPNRAERLPAFLSGGAGIFSTIDDYSKFASMLLENGEYGGHRYLSPETLKYFTAGGQQYLPVYNEMPLKYEWMSGYNYGNLMRCCVEPEKTAMLSNKGEYGWDGWLGTVLMNDPVSETTFLLMMQKTEAGFNECARIIKNLLWR